ncbi:MAG: ATP-binding protein, partial [Phycisphaerae bacterium]
AKAHALVSMTEQGSGGIKIDLEPDQMPEFRKGSHPDYFVLLDNGGKEIAKSESLAEVEWPSAMSGVSERPAHSAVKLPDHRRGRMVQFAFVPRSEDEEHPVTAPLTSVIIVARDATELNGKLVRMAWLLSGVFGLAMVLSASAMAWVVSRGLRPLGLLADRIHAMGSTNLSERVRLAEAPDEMLPVVERLNELLARVETNLTRERAFTADVAHELRTPLAGLIVAMQVGLSRRRSPEDYEAVLTKCLGVSDAMRSMVENLLTLARADAQQVQPACEEINLVSLLHDQWQQFDGLARQRQLQVEWSLPDQLTVKTDPGLLTTVLRNLFDNAVTYCDTGGRTSVEVHTQSAEAVIRLTNTGSQIPAEDASKVFERFWRGDAARTVAGHCGLGLALCERIILLLGGSIAAQTTLGGSFVVEIRFP